MLFPSDLGSQHLLASTCSVGAFEKGKTERDRFMSGLEKAPYWGTEKTLICLEVQSIFKGCENLKCITENVYKNEIRRGRYLVSSLDESRVWGGCVGNDSMRIKPRLRPAI